ncbi:hypothetical protein PaMx11_54 [Pseudomonas phage PaMx11]|uniref:Uncharacterized protein n=1 Tax=Pseudomonas phage PaMx11 TaxID=1175657 RepID=A0A0S0N865_BPPAM|nr:hypothetical protein AVV52_gp54 [Pseudomonas phage PaMx11]ALH23728.1 hypothetical protein PaMx11_54 [Pseudomonas phage PaMx11]
MRIYRPTTKAFKLKNFHELRQVIVETLGLTRAYYAKSTHACASINQEDFAQALALQATHALLRTTSGVFLSSVEELQEALKSVPLVCSPSQPGRNYWKLECPAAWAALVGDEDELPEPEPESLTYTPRDPARPFEEVIALGHLPKDFYNATQSRLLSHRPKHLLSVTTNLQDGSITISRRKG